MIHVTDNAIKKIKSSIINRGKGLGIRLGVKPTGCSGLAYIIEFADNFQLGDSIFSFDGCKIVIAASSMSYLEGITLDYSKQGLNEGFEFINPKEKSRCGCGESFRV